MAKAKTKKKENKTLEQTIWASAEKLRGLLNHLNINMSFYL